MTSRSAQIAGTIRQALQLDRDWMRAVEEDNRDYTPWMPFNSISFIALLAESLTGADVSSRTRRDLVFLDVGCGPGCKMLIARDIFGLDVHGFDRREEYVKAARTLGLDADVADAETYDGYGAADIIWANRVARNGVIQARIEQKMIRDMSPGAIVIMANYELDPPPWLPVLEDAEARRGIWQKPAPASARLPGSKRYGRSCPQPGMDGRGEWFPSTAQEPFPRWLACVHARPAGQGSAGSAGQKWPFSHSK